MKQSSTVNRNASSLHIYEVRPCKDHRGVNLISDALPFGRQWYGELNAVGNAVAQRKPDYTQTGLIFAC